MHSRIKSLRKEAGLTQAALAERVNVRRETIVFLEAGKYNPSLKLAHAVARTLGTTIEHAFGLDEGSPLDTAAGPV